MEATTRVVAMVAMDVVGYTRLMIEDHAGTLERLRHVRDSIVEPAIASHNGSVCKRLGDGWLAAFEHPSDALLCAAQIQDSLAEPGALQLRIGVHRGKASFVDEDVFGTSVNVAARLEALAKPGGIAVTESTLDDVDGALRSEFENAGPRSLKNVPEPLVVWTRGGLPDAAQGSPGSAQTSILVRGFATNGEAPVQAVADDLAGGLETDLARFRWLTVVSRTHAADNSPFARYTLDGRLQMAGQRVRVTASLTFTADGRRLWSDRFDAEGSDPFALQDEMAATLSPLIATAIDTNEKTLAQMRPVEALSASELSMRTNDLVSTGRVDALEEAQALALRAVALEPQNAVSHAQLSLVLYSQARSGAWPARQTLNAALEPAHEATRVDPLLSTGQVMLTSIYAMLGETERALNGAIEAERLNPNAWGANHGRAIAYGFAEPAWAQANDRDADGLIAHAEATLQMASGSRFRSGHLFFLGLGLMLRGGEEDEDQAIAILSQSAAAVGASWWPSLFLALAELRREDEDAARSHIATARHLFPALSLAVTEGLFGRTRVWPAWRRQLSQLPDCGLPEV